MSTGYSLLIVFVIIALLLSSSLEIANGFLSSADSVWRRKNCDGWRTPRGGDDLIRQVLPPKNPLMSLNSQHDYMIGGKEVDIMKGGTGPGCYYGGNGQDQIILRSIGNKVQKYVIDDDQNRDMVVCEGSQKPAMVTIEGRKGDQYIQVIECPNKRYVG
jgi:hypothetical protein